MSTKVSVIATLKRADGRTTPLQLMYQYHGPREKIGSFLEQVRSTFTSDMERQNLEVIDCEFVVEDASPMNLDDMDVIEVAEATSAEEV